MSSLGCEMCAHRQADQILSISQRPGFVEIINAPDQAAFAIAPSAEIFYVKIAHRQYMRRLGQIGADSWPKLCPAVVGGAQKWKDRSFHAAVFEMKVLLDDVG